MADDMPICDGCHNHEVFVCGQRACQEGKQYHWLCSKCWDDDKCPACERSTSRIEPTKGNER